MQGNNPHSQLRTPFLIFNEAFGSNIEPKATSLV